MNQLTRQFLSICLFFTRFQLAIAKAAPEWNRNHICKLQYDEHEYESAILSLEIRHLTSLK